MSDGERRIRRALAAYESAWGQATSDSDLAAGLSAAIPREGAPLRGD
jgi:hypothetical protein